MTCPKVYGDCERPLNFPVRDAKALDVQVREHHARTSPLIFLFKRAEALYHGSR